MRPGFLSLFIVLWLGSLPLLPAQEPAATQRVTMTVDASDVSVEGGSPVTAPARARAEKPTPTTPAGALATLTDSMREMLRGFIRFLPTLGIAVIVLISTAFVAAIARKIAGKIMTRLHLKESLRDLARLLLNIAVWFVGLMLTAGIIFPGFGFAQIVATAGLASIAIGFAFKDIFENFFAGILILWNYPFETGDFIEVEGQDIMGRVEDIWIRVSLIRQVDGQLIIVPNSTLYTNPVRVLTSQPLRRVELICGVAYGEDVDKSREVITAAVESCELVNKDRPIQVFAFEFADSAINFEIRWWSASTPVGQKQAKDQVVSAVKRALDTAGIEIPFPYRTLTFKKSDPLFTAPREQKEG